jgi:hypothetical protein
MVRVNFNIPLEIVCISWCKNFDNVKMHGTTVEKSICNLSEEIWPETSLLVPSDRTCKILCRGFVMTILNANPI